MATLAELEAAMDTADRAGDTEAAQMFADDIRAGNYTDAPQAPPAAPLSGTLGLPRSLLAAPGLGPLGPLGAALGAALTPGTSPTVDVPVPGGVEAGAIGAGRTLTRLGRGMQDIAQRVRGDATGMADTRARETEEAALYAPLQAERPGATLAGEVAPYLATAPLGAPAGLLGSAGLGAGMSSLEYQPTLAGRGRAAAAGAAGGGLGYGLGRLMTRLAGGRGSQLDPAMEARAARGEELGFRLTPAERSGSRTAEQIEATLSSNPLTSEPFHAIREANQETLNRITARAIGLSDDVTRITEDKLDDAVDAIGNQFDEALGDQVVRLGSEFADQLDAIQARYSSTWGKGDKLLKVIKDARREMSQSEGVISADRYKQLQTMLREEAQTAISGRKADSALGRAIFEVKDALDDAALASIPAERMSMFRDAQAKWKAYRSLGAALNTDTGNVSGKVLANTLRRGDETGYRLGRNASDLYDAARFSKAFSSQIGDSGTATRMALWNVLSGSGALGGAGALIGMSSERVDPESAAMLGLLPLMGRGAANVYTSRLAQRGLLPMTQGAQRAVSAGAGGALAGASGSGAR